MSALGELQAALQEAKTEAATLRIEVDVYRDAARAAVAYLAAHSALTAAGVSPERPDAARRLGDAWVALTKACANVPACGPEQDRGAAASRPADHVCAVCDGGPGNSNACTCPKESIAVPPLPHPFLPAPFYPERCDARVEDDGKRRQCGQPRNEHQP